MTDALTHTDRRKRVKNFGTRCKEMFMRKVAYDTNGRVWTVSRETVKCLTEGDEVFMALVAKGDGTIQIHPLQVPPGTITVNRLNFAIRGSARICIPKGVVGSFTNGTRYKCVWDGANDCLVITHEAIP